MAKLKFYQTEAFEPIHVPNIVMKVKPYLYCTKKKADGGIHHPDAQVKVLADLWICVGPGKKGFRSKSVSADYIPRCEIDLDTRTITKKGEPIVCDNIDAVLDVVQERVFSPVEG